jgi:hypothetical protein
LSIIVNCPDCGAPVSVPDSLLGRQVKCQRCEAIFIVERQAKEAPRAPAPAPPAPPKRLPDFSPAELEPRLPRGYADHDEETRGRTAPPLRRRPRRDEPYEEFEDEPPVSFDYLHPAPHRGSTVLTLGVFSILSCCLPPVGIGLGLGAIRLAMFDLTEIDSGRMDPSGRGQTQTGQVCGYLGCALSLFALIAEMIMVFGKR